ncbi:hypothetical protein, partial [Pseudaminobacter sp. NGMCC 1.201702]|uniref:hypothetical protein n=1 Tax=Pseudaminobacter sp. NGMCC 1.201702 TaxID=3391825 RepID=UPI0039F0744A
DKNANVSRAGHSPLSLSDVSKFTALAALLAIFVDAAIGHAMLWGNDPYWTYWITDTLLMATVFGLGTAWLGIGLVRGAVITAVHMVLLTVYYWSLSPIGLPSQPEWLDLEHTWITGLPVHFAVYYLGYVIALWAWRHRLASGIEPEASTARSAALGVGVAIAVVIAAGLLQALVLGQFPGVTWFVMRIAVASAFTVAWWSIAGRDRTAAVGGGIMLGFLLVAYGHFLGPIGLPNSEFRLFAENPPPAEVHWLSYRQEFLVILPMTIFLAVSSYLLTSRPGSTGVEWGRQGLVAGAGSALALAVVGGVVALYTGPEAKTAVITAQGSASIGQAPSNGGDLAPGSATLRMRVEDRNTHRTPLPPHDLVNIEASVSSPDGRTYVIQAAEAMVVEPRGRFTTWHGVGFDVWHHGRSGIGYAGLPAMQSNVAVYALGTARSGEQSSAIGVPVHVLTSSRDGARLELHVGVPGSPEPGIPGGYLRVTWPEYQGGHDPALSYARYAWGGGVLIVLLGFAVAAARREQEPAINHGRSTG